MYSTPVYTDNFICSPDIEKVCTDEYEYTSGSPKISVRKNIISDKALEEVKNIIKNNFIIYLKKLSIKNNFKFTQSWITMNDKGDMHGFHRHWNTFFSCVYYVYSEGNSLIFRNPNFIEANTNYELNFETQNLLNGSTVIVPVKTGDIVIFPGWLNHCSSINQSEKTKIMIGVNFYLTNSIGEENKLNYTEL
tara:strand:- start:763 stop:1338 length:576 start_codon:yes stop_codon:yes gene_type:complete